MDDDDDGVQGGGSGSPSRCILHGSGFVDTDSHDDGGGGGEYRELRLDFITTIFLPPKLCF
jgi:hypothetical protein